MFTRLLSKNVKHNLNIPYDETKKYLIRFTDLENRIVKIQDNVEVMTYSLYSVGFVNIGYIVVKMLW
jgi:hypothetical protein